MTVHYEAPLPQIRHAIDQAAGSTGLIRLPACRDALTDVADSVLENAARFAREVLSPLNPIGDRKPARCTPEGVLCSPGFVEAYKRFAADGWTALGAPAEYGGLALPTLVGAAAGEMWAGANMSFAMCTEVAAGAIEALRAHATHELRRQFLTRIVSGEWTAAMALTEPQAGSDLSTLRTRAAADGETWRLFGTKIYISWGEHDLTDNIVHLVLARTADAPEGLRGVSMFLVPKRWPRADGTTEANDLRALSIEHKMGIRASPTCVMAYGESEGARGWLVGERNAGIACMFTMMNHMRVGVGVHSLGCAQRALQLARAHAHERLQGRNQNGAHRPIIEHADVRRMLLTMKALTHAARHLVYTAAAMIDVARLSEGAGSRDAAETRLALLTPVVKAWVSDVAVEVASLGVQIHGGSGYVDDSEISQIYRDARIGPIFEGTNYIQAQDLLARKVVRDGGTALRALLESVGRSAEALPAGHAKVGELRVRLLDGASRMNAVTAGIIDNAPRDAELIGSVAHHFLQWLGLLLGGWQWSLAARQAIAKPVHDDEARPVLDTAAFYAAHILPRALTHEAAIAAGSAPVAAATLSSL